MGTTMTTDTIPRVVSPQRFEVEACVHVESDSRVDTYITLVDRGRLAAWSDKSYVTWTTFVDRETGEVESFWGHYDMTRDEAYEDLVQRAGYTR